MSNKRSEEERLQVMLHVRRAITNAVKRISMEHMSSICDDDLPGVKMSLQGDSLFERGIVENLGRTNSPTSARHGDGLKFIRI